ncbi:hypothetical protein BOTBODRAFT_171282 [Botryobasidium botryosum FD-172 SS1]|uniref:Uncharacterized protein n=1 Tax=Botryobasidium botryosum (strain FD-172 SS1) TaxID=930990 RepID=A0A067MUR0_BOTB1|nr:hypothetical protein BOTBODRAFT_171282 [Botryobasidium botryosum FD-172 SS1]
MSQDYQDKLLRELFSKVEGRGQPRRSMTKERDPYQEVLWLDECKASSHTSDPHILEGASVSAESSLELVKDGLGPIALNKAAEHSDNDEISNITTSLASGSISQDNRVQVIYGESTGIVIDSQGWYNSIKARLGSTEIGAPLLVTAESSAVDVVNVTQQRLEDHIEGHAMQGDEPSEAARDIAGRVQVSTDGFTESTDDSMDTALGPSVASGGLRDSPHAEELASSTDESSQPLWATHICGEQSPRNKYDPIVGDDPEVLPSVVEPSPGAIARGSKGGPCAFVATKIANSFHIFHTSDGTFSPSYEGLALTWAYIGDRAIYFVEASSLRFIQAWGAGKHYFELYRLQVGNLIFAQVTQEDVNTFVFHLMSWWAYVPSIKEASLWAWYIYAQVHAFYGEPHI